MVVGSFISLHGSGLWYVHVRSSDRLRQAQNCPETVIYLCHGLRARDRPSRLTTIHRESDVTAPARTHDTAHVRNIALVGHAGAGKTTLLEQLLARSGAIHSPGTVEKGNTVSDFTGAEKKQGHSLETALCNLEHDGIYMNILDTPGYPDFIGRSISVLPGVETAALVINAQSGVEMVARRVMRYAEEQRMCRLIIVNHIDTDGLDLRALLDEIRDSFGPQCLPLNLPADSAKTVADCFFEPADTTPDFSSVEAAHTAIVDQVVELDDKLMELYLEQGEALQPEQLHDPFERALRRGHLIPVCFVSAGTGSGLNQLLNIFARLMPSPLEANPPAFIQGEGESARPVEVTGDPDGHFIGHVFKVNVDPYVGKMGIFRVHQGTLRHGDQVFVGERRKGFKVAHLYRLQGRETSEINRVVPGDICAISKVEDLHFDAVLHTSHDEDRIHLQSVRLPEPMYGVALELVRRGDEKKLSDALHKLAAEDPSLRIEH
ncbi:MAG TPA: GTP-binding protein, partial [Chromatiales bacterium]|nr:GTP-binding protein [Chromatiales bacterium]